EFLKLAVHAISHRPDSDSIRVYFGADSASSIVDSKPVDTGLGRCIHLGEDRESLHRLANDFMVHYPYLAIRLLSVRRGRIFAKQRVDWCPVGRIVEKAAGRLFSVRPGCSAKPPVPRARDNRSQIAVDYIVLVIQHPQNISSGARVPGGILGIVVDDWLVERRETISAFSMINGEVHILLGHLAAIPFGRTRLHVYRTEQPLPQLLSGRAQVPCRVQQVSSFLLGKKDIGTTAPGVVLQAAV